MISLLFNLSSYLRRSTWLVGEGKGRVRAGKTPQAFSAARSLTGFWTGAKTGLPSFSFLAMAKMQQSAAIAMTAAAMRPPMSPTSV